jgi:hypothetical protein
MKRSWASNERPARALCINITQVLSGEEGPITSEIHRRLPDKQPQVLRLGDGVYAVICNTFRLAD